MYKVTSSNAQNYSGPVHPETQNPARVDIYRSPEAMRLEELGQTVEWMRNAAVTTGVYNYEKVNELGKPEETIIDGFGKKILGAKSNETISALEMTMRMLRAEAKLGGDILDVPDKNITYEFFCSDSGQWTSVEHVKQMFSLSEVLTMINYKVYGQGIQKSYSNSKRPNNIQLGTMDAEHTGNLLAVAEIYVEYIGRTLYPEHYQYYKDWQEAQSYQQKIIAAEAVTQNKLAAEAMMQSELVKPGDFAWAS